MAEHIDYFDDWKTRTMVCPDCGWKGRWDDGVEYYDGLMDCSCPKCDRMLAIVAYPTIAEAEANWSRLTPLQQLEVKVKNQFATRWEAAHLRSPDQLPELDGADLTLTWDFVEEEPFRFTVLRHGDTEIWREPALYEGFSRFADVVAILRQKYGSRLADVVPTPASGYYLYGDRLFASDDVEGVREALKEGRGLTPPSCECGGAGVPPLPNLRPERSEGPAYPVSTSGTAHHSPPIRLSVRGHRSLSERGPWQSPEAGSEGGGLLRALRALAMTGAAPPSVAARPGGITRASRRGPAPWDLVKAACGKLRW